MKYAKNTTVSSDKSKAEIERTLTRYGADSFMYGWQGNQAMVAFVYGGKQMRFLLPMPDRNEERFTHHSQGRRAESAAEKIYEQEIRQRWRALLLSIKSRLEEVESEISTFEEAFMGKIVLPDGQTVADWIMPQIEQAYVSGNMPKMLPAPEEPQIIDAVVGSGK